MAADPYSADNPRDLLDTHLNDADGRFLYLAKGQLVGDCMREAGFEYSELPPGDNQRGRNSGEYAFDDVEAARSTGYGLSLRDDDGGGDLAGEVLDPNVEYQRSLNDQQRADFQEALFGSATHVHHSPDEAPDDTIDVTRPDGTKLRLTGTRGGCVGEVRRQLYGSIEKFDEVSTFHGWISHLLYGNIEGDARIDQAVAEWRQCMIERGYSYDTPSDAFNQVGIAIFEGEAGADPQFEIDVATADAECNRQTDLADRAHAVEAEHVAALLDEYQSQLVEVRLMRQRAVERARELTSPEGA